ncbi:MAG: bifunctional phosphoribosylaminoimidazolecarboxamide formyltransferase/IMP cyclohydrolase [Thermoplasmata archaeon]
MTPEAAGAVPVRRALLSVFDPTGLDLLVEGLVRHQVELWATEGTRRRLERPDRPGHPIRPAEELTGIGSWFGGRIKTLHPGLLGGILAPRTPEGSRELAERGLLPFDLVVVNFYPFEERAGERPPPPDLEESIDVGGVTLARGAAKNHAAVAVLVGPAQYHALVEALDRGGGTLGAEYRRALAARAFARVEEYDRAIARAFAGPAEAAGGFPESLSFLRHPIPLRYGENPHQAAQPYVLAPAPTYPMVPLPLEPLQGDSLSYTNMVDLDTALGVLSEFALPTAAVVKHATPTGVASAPTIREALELAVATDPVARYGCVVAVNRPLADGDAGPLSGIFVDLLAAPEFAPSVREALRGRRKLKIVRAHPFATGEPRWEAKSALGRLLVQEVDRRQLTVAEFRTVTVRRVSPEESCALDFAWRVVRHAKSNAIVLARGSVAVGIGSGQPTRVKAVELACGVAGERARGAVLASDAFFPFADGIEVAARAGVAAILQPGGSLRDAEVIAAADRNGLAMCLTGWRVFRH